VVSCTTHSFTRISGSVWDTQNSSVWDNHLANHKVERVMRRSCCCSHVPTRDMNWVLEFVRTYNSSAMQTRRVRRKESLARYESAVLPHGGRRWLVRGSCVRGTTCFSCMYTFTLYQHTRSTEDMPIWRVGRANCNGDEYQLGKTYGELVGNVPYHYLHPRVDSGR